MNFTKKDVVVLALAQLGAFSVQADTEDVAIAAHAIAPEAFGWRKHPTHIEIDTVRTSLRHEAESTEPRIVGSIRHGWSLTASGRAWAETAARERVTVAALTGGGRRRAETSRTATLDGRVRGSEAFRFWLRGESIPNNVAAAVFRIDEYTPTRERHLKTARLRETVLDQPDLVEFIDSITPAAIELSAPRPKGGTSNE